MTQASDCRGRGRQQFNQRSTAELLHPRPVHIRFVLGALEDGPSDELVECRRQVLLIVPDMVVGAVADGCSRVSLPALRARRIVRLAQRANVVAAGSFRQTQTSLAEVLGI